MDSTEYSGISYFLERSNDPVHYCRRITLQNGVTLLYDDYRGCADGSDGNLYYAVCREIPGEDGDIEILGWSAEIPGEILLKQ